MLLNSLAVCNYCKPMASNEFGKKNIMSSLSCFVLMMHVIFFPLLKYITLFSSDNFELSERHQSELYMKPSTPSVGNMLCDNIVYSVVVFKLLTLQKNMPQCGTFWFVVFVSEIWWNTGPTRALTWHRGISRHT